MTLKEKIKKILIMQCKEDDSAIKVDKPTDQVLSLISDTIKECVGEAMKWDGGEAELHIQIADGYNQKRNEIINNLQQHNLWNEK